MGRHLVGLFGQVAPVTGPETQQAGTEAVRSFQGPGTLHLRVENLDKPVDVAVARLTGRGFKSRLLHH